MQNDKFKSNLESLSKMSNEYQELKYTKQKILQNDQFQIKILYDNDDKKKYVLTYDRNNNLLKVEEYHDNYVLHIDKNKILLQTGINKIKFTYQEILHPSTLQFTRNRLDKIIKNLQSLNLAQIYFGIKKQQLTDSEANEVLMNYVHISRNVPHSSANLINIDQKLYKENDLWLDLNEDVQPVNFLISQYQDINQDIQIIRSYLDKLKDSSLLDLENLFNKNEKIIFVKQDILHDVGWKLAGSAAELLVTDRLHKLSNSISFHNMILPFDYGQGKKQNQIDNVLVNEKGIFCIEVKSKEVTNEVYNFDREEKQYSYIKQVINHVHAVKSYLLQQGLFIESKYIHPVILIMNRSSEKEKQSFKIINSLPLQVIGFNDIENLNRGIDESLTSDKLNQISNLLNLSNTPEPTYVHYNFLPKLTPSIYAIKQFKDNLEQLTTLISKLAESLGQYYKVKNYQKMINIIRKSPSFQCFNNYK